MLTMAHYDEKSGNIILSESDQEVFKECSYNITNKKTPIADSIMRKILPKELTISNNEI